MALPGPNKPDVQLQTLIDLISNATDAYTTALFIAPAKDQPLKLYAYQSLSRNIDEEVEIGAGEGLVGWVYKNNEPVNVDKFDQDTRRLIFYKTDEAIKSFMAVPLTKINAVLAVDSKQRYVFTEKSQKILWHFGQVVQLAFQRVRQSERGRMMAEALTFLAQMEGVLSKRLDEGESMDRAVALFREYTGASAGFITAVLPGNPGHYFVMAANSAATRNIGTGKKSMEAGLAGWVMQNKKPLLLDRGRSEAARSFVFQPDEPLGDFPAFAGWPIMWSGRLRGAVLLLGEKTFGFEDTKQEVLQIAVDRLAISVEMELLFKRVSELSRLDTQVGLPHRTYFVERLDRQIKVCGVQGTGLGLFLVRFDNLDDVAGEFGQGVAQELLKAGGRYLLGGCPEDSELGHVTYGVIGLAICGGHKPEVKADTMILLEKLEARHLETSAGHLKLKIRTAWVKFPGDGDRAEDLLRLGLDGLNGAAPVRDKG